MNLKHRGLYLICGFFALVGGTWWLSRPAALIAAGVLLLAAGIFGGRRPTGGE